jgi:D-serine deaminase-like pyridoxal phosphate-dependent protein
LHKFDIDTPALLLDVDLLQTNIDRLAAWAAGAKVALRPHFKVHRTPEISKLQLKAGAVGVTVAKVSEAEVAVEHGLGEVLIANEICGQQKIERLVQLCRRQPVMSYVDCHDGLDDLEAAAEAHGVVLDLLPDVDVGMNRCGASVEVAVELAERIHRSPHLNLRGLGGYEGHLGAQEPGEGKTAAITHDLHPLGVVVKRVREAGIPVPLVTAASSGTFRETAGQGWVTEVQPGTYALGDLLYNKGGCGSDYAMAVLATVMSRAGGRVITDAGMKALHPRFGGHIVKDHPRLKLRGLAAEHGIWDVEGTCGLRVGDKVEIIPDYADGTINLHLCWELVQDGRTVGRWDIVGHGASK